jgi:hypothetical protein
VARFAHEIALVLGLVALVFWLLALVSHSAQDAAWSTTGTGGAIRNWGGKLGAWLADLSYFTLGFSVWWCFAAGVRAWMAAGALDARQCARACCSRSAVQPHAHGFLDGPGSAAVRQHGAGMVAAVPL